MRISHEEHQKACSVLLADFLLKHYPDQVIENYGSVLLLKDRHVSVIKGPTSHGYKNWKTGEKGNPIDYLIKYLGHDYKSAVKALTEDYAQTYFEPSEQRNFNLKSDSCKKEIKLPTKSKKTKNICAYLDKQRGIPNEVINYLIDEGLLYQDDRNNAVFVSKNKDYFERRGTYTFAEERCKLRNECKRYVDIGNQKCRNKSNCNKFKKDVFHGCGKASKDCYWSFTPNGDADVAFVCEAAIDAISLYVINKRNGNDVKAEYISIGGVANQQTIEKLKQNKKVIIAVDNDKAGNACYQKNSDCERIIPIGKDWNEDLKKGTIYEK